MNYIELIQKLLNPIVLKTNFADKKEVGLSHNLFVEILEQ